MVITSRLIISFFFCALCVRPALAADPFQLRTDAKMDKLFENEKPFVICNYPIKAAGCDGLCADMKMHYDEMKDVNGRDIEPKKGLANPERYNTDGLTQRKILVSQKPPYESETIPYKQPVAEPSMNEPYKPVDGKLTTFEVGNANDKDCKWATIWVHGADDRKGDLGAVDNIFGAAFNRMKHLAQENHGLYYSPTIDDFGSDDGVVALIKHIRNKTCPKGKIVLNCGSAGANICYALANDTRVTGDLGGMVVIGGGSPGPLKDYEMIKNRVPLLITQGEKDHPDGAHQAALALQKADPTYPIRYVEFEKGGHMTPLRMLDWRQTMNCMMNQAPAVGASANAAPGSGAGGRAGTSER